MICASRRKRPPRVADTASACAPARTDARRPFPAKKVRCERCPRAPTQLFPAKLRPFLSEMAKKSKKAAPEEEAPKKKGKKKAAAKK